MFDTTTRVEFLRKLHLFRGLSEEELVLVADELQAQTTPHAFVIDPAGLLRYRGAIDDVTFRKRTPEHFHIEAAVEAILSGRIPTIQETPPCGCTIVRL